MSINVSFALGNFAQGFCWQNPQQFAQAMVDILTGTIPDMTGVIISDTTPSADNQDKLWIKTDNNGLPVGLFIYLGGWVWPHQVPYSSKERMIFVGTEAELKVYDGGVDEAVTSTTGPFWEPDSNMAVRFPMGAGTLPISSTVVEPTDTGGLEKVSLSEAEMPPHNHECNVVSSDGVFGTVLEALQTSNEAKSGVAPSYQNSADGGDPFTKDAGGTAGTVEAHQNLPPYYAVIFAKRTARIYRTP